MDFGTTGRRLSTGFLLLMLVGATAALAQPDAGCELPLVVPASTEITTELQSTSRGPGLVVTWPEPDDASSTCVALTDTAGLGIPMAVFGDYGDDFDRTLEFSFTEDGTVGDAARNRFVCTWNNINTTRTGTVVGEINLSNTGGLWIRDDLGAWAQSNEGLPYYLPYTNVVDLDRADDGTLFLALSAGAQAQNDPVGVYVATPGGDWTEVASEHFGGVRKVTEIAVDPASAQRFAVGTSEDGVFVTTDGGATFTQWERDLGPGAPSIPVNFEVTALSWTDARLYVAVRAFGLFISEDDGASFERQDGLDVPSAPGNTNTVNPKINVVLEDPADAARILVGLTSHGVWETIDGGENWASIMVNYEGSSEGWTVSVESLLIDTTDGEIITAGTTAQLIRRTLDGGENWTSAVTPYDALLVKPTIRDLIHHDGGVYGLAAGELQSGSPSVGLLETADGGATWTIVADQPYNRNARCVVSAGTELLLPTVGGGVYVAGRPVPLTATVDRGTTDADLLDINLGLSITFEDGAVTLQDVDGDGQLEARGFKMICQDYQGWIIWRSPRGDIDNMVMIGRYDKNNPETCIEGYCGDENFVLLPNCFNERRAACFDFSVPGQVSFYDDDVFNGFSYYYAVTPFDFGDISQVLDPVSIDTPMVFPNRFSGDDYGLGDGLGNRFDIQVNVNSAASMDGEEIYAYPNPLRLGSGIVGGEGEEVIWTNLPPESRIQIFTLAGDEIAELPADAQEQQQLGGNMYWVARNNDGHLLASGIYIWRVIMPERGDFWGKLVIVR